MSDPLRASLSIEIKPESDELFIPISEDLGPTTWPQLCIYRVPRRLRSVNPSAYTPTLVSIGPLHHGNKQSQAMETQKPRYLRDFCERTGMTSSQLVVLIKEKEVTIRRCYEEDSKLCSKKFVRMILLDSVFIIELFLKKHRGKEDYFSSNPRMSFDLLRDLITLENQLPWFILEELYNLSFPNKTYPVSLIGLAVNFMEETRRRYDQSDQKQNKLFGDCEAAQQENPIHIVDLVRKRITCGLESPKCGRKGITKLYNATKLHGAGVKFRSSSRESPQPGIKFDGGVLFMPLFEVNDTSECMYRNLMAFEQCHPPYHSYVCDLILFLDSLIDSENDVDLLVQSGVIVNFLGESGAVSRMVNKLGKEIALTGSPYYNLSEELNAYADNWWNGSMATLKSVYFPNLWRGTGTVAASVALVLTFIQTFYAVKHH